MTPSNLSTSLCRSLTGKNLAHGLFRAVTGVLVIVLSPVLLLACAPLAAQEDLAEKASKLMQAGQFHEAELVWRQLEAAEPKNPAVHSNLGVALAQQGQLSSAAAEYRASLTLDPRQPEVAFDLGVSEFKQGHFREAIPAFKTVQRSKANDGRSTLLLGMSYYGLQEYASAIPYLRIGVQTDPKNLELRNVLAQSCLWGKDYACALDEFKSIVSTNPDAVQAHMLMAEALDAMGRTQDAIGELENAAALAPKEPALHFELGFLYYKKLDYEKAAPELQAEIDNNPGYAQAYLYLGDIALRRNDAATAEPLLKKGLAVQEARLGYFDLGCIYADRKEDQAALTAFQHAIQLDPAQPDAHYRLARVYAHLGRKQEALAEFAKTKELHAKTDDTLIQQVSGGGATNSP